MVTSPVKDCHMMRPFCTSKHVLTYVCKKKVVCTAGWQRSSKNQTLYSCPSAALKHGNVNTLFLQSGGHFGSARPVKDCESALAFDQTRLPVTRAQSGLCCGEQNDRGNAPNRVSPA